MATSDAEVSRLAGLSVGMPLGPDTAAAAAERLRAAKRFESVEVLKRYASLADPSAIVLVVIAACARIHAALAPAWSGPLLELAAFAWAGAFIGFAIAYGPLLWRRRKTVIAVT